MADPKSVILTHFTPLWFIALHRALLRAVAPGYGVVIAPRFQDHLLVLEALRADIAGLPVRTALQRWVQARLLAYLDREIAATEALIDLGILATGLLPRGEGPLGGGDELEPGETQSAGAGH